MRRSCRQTLDYEVLIPAHHAEDTLARAISSAATLSPAPSAVRVCIDGIGDQQNAATLEVARTSVADEVLSLTVNSGVGTVRQRLLDAAQSRYVVFLDSDDEFLPFAAEAWLYGLERAPDASAISFGWRPMGERVGRPECFDVRPVSHAALWRANRLTSSAALVRTHDARAVGGFSPGTRRLVDYELWLKMAAAGMSLYSGTDPIVIRSVSPTSITGDVSAAVERELELLDKLKPPGCTARQHALRAYQAWARGVLRTHDYGEEASGIAAFRELCPDGRTEFRLGRWLLGPRAARLILVPCRRSFRAGWLG